MPVFAIRRLLAPETQGGLALLAAAAVALALANSPLAGFYAGLLALPVGVHAGAAGFEMALNHWVNDALMAVFFALVALEIKREMLEGALSTRAAALLPAIAAVGGMVVPAALYAIVNRSDAEALRGWAIPTATDIAFAMAVMALPGRRVPLALRIFLLALAVFDDLGAIAIIAIFYSVDLSPQALGLAAAGIGVLAGLNRAGVGRSAPYMLVFVFIWACVLQSGVHATLAGVVVGFSVPLRTANGESPLRRLEAMLHPWVTFAVLPLFALANAGVPLAAEMPSPVTLGIVLGLFVGKQAGVMAAAWLAVRSGLAVLPEGANWRSFHAAAVLTGIGFTMSLFIGTLALRPDAAQAMRTGVLAGSLLSAAVGYVLLHLACPQAEIAESGQK